MATLTKMSSIMVILLLGSFGVMISPGQAIRAPAPAPARYKFLQDCATNLGNCGFDVYMAVFKNRNLSVKCCTKLVSTGKVCHDDLVRHLLLGPDFKGNLTETLARSEQVWNGCLVSASSPSS